jgi:hypothetical protein
MLFRPRFLRLPKPVEDMTEDDWKAAEQAYCDAVCEETYEEEMWEQWAKDNGYKNLEEAHREIMGTTEYEYPESNNLLGYSTIAHKT